MTILAIDQASCKSGYSVGINGKLVQYGIVEAKGKGENRVCLMAELVKNKIQEINPNIIFIEGVQLQSGNAKTYNILSKLQGMIIWIAREFGIPLVVVPPVTWKSSIGICKGKRDEQKKACVEYIEKTYDIDLFGSDDIADSIGILTYAMNNYKKV